MSLEKMGPKSCPKTPFFGVFWPKWPKMAKIGVLGPPRDPPQTPPFLARGPKGGGPGGPIWGPFIEAHEGEKGGLGDPP